jgi:lipopolysaccharide transport system ATP-binding protein
MDSIVDFAGIRQFIDMPVKRYSSGMYVRLGFAIAAHLDPDILLLDEVLAVGDAAFQAKCIQRVKELEAAGTTIVFISHDLVAVERLCQRAILMNKGEVVAEGTARDVIEQYKNRDDHLAASEDGLNASRIWRSLGESPGNDVARLRSVRVCTEREETSAIVDIRRPVGIEMTYDVLEPGHVLIPNCHFFNEDGQCAFIAHDLDPEWHRRAKPAGKFISTVWIPGDFLAEGKLSVLAALSSFSPLIVHFAEADVVSLNVIDSFAGDSARGDYVGHMPGIVRPRLEWTTRLADTAQEPWLVSSGVQAT